MIPISTAPAVEPAMMDLKALGWHCQCLIMLKDLLVRKRTPFVFVLAGNGRLP